MTSEYVRMVVKVADEESFQGDIVERIKAHIGAATLVIVDLSGSRPNVLYEVGFADARKKPVILISSTMKALHFDVRNWRVVEYSPGRTHQLAKKLQNEVRTVFAAL